MHPPGTIIVPNAGHFRHVAFIRDLFQCEKPPGTRVAFPTSGNIVQNLNRTLVELHGEWAWFQADDHTFPPDLLTKLLDHDADIVVPLITKRSPPYHLVIGTETTVEDEHSGRTYPAYETISLEDVPAEPFHVEIAGTGGMLVREHVFDALGYPYFESTDGLYLNEDIVFSQKVRAAGFQILVDPELKIGHIASTPVWPAR